MSNAARHLAHVLSIPSAFAQLRLLALSCLAYPHVTTAMQVNYHVHILSIYFVLCTKRWLNSAGTGPNGVPAPLFSVSPPEIADPPLKAAVPQPGDTVPSWWWNGNFSWFRHNKSVRHTR